MTNITPEQVIITVALIWIIICAIYTATSYYIIRTKLEYMESFLKSAKWIRRTQSFLNMNSWESKLYRFNILLIMLLFPKTMARRGEVDLKELYSIPSGLRLLVKATVALGIVACLLLAGLYFCIDE